MNERPTPIVDSCEFTVPIAGRVIASKTARRLERERDEAREAFVIATDQMVQAQCKTREALRERDEARQQVLELKAYGVEDDQTIDRLIRERNEAREAAAKWESSSDAMERAGAEQAHRADENREWALRAERERDEAREVLREIAEASGFDNIGNWARNKARKCFSKTAGK